jgi:hypothetical protein
MSCRASSIPVGKIGGRKSGDRKSGDTLPVSDEVSETSNVVPSPDFPRFPCPALDPYDNEVDITKYTVFYFQYDKFDRVTLETVLRPLLLVGLAALDPPYWLDRPYWFDPLCLPAFKKLLRPDMCKV